MKKKEEGEEGQKQQEKKEEEMPTTLDSYFLNNIQHTLIVFKNQYYRRQN